jgi:glyoxylate/hydroxypyruvate reductase A
MNALLLSVTVWDAEPWLQRFRRLLPEHLVTDKKGDIAPGTTVYVAAWKPNRGALADIPNIAAIFSLGAGVDHLLGDSSVPDVPIIRSVNVDLRNRMSEWAVLHALAHLRQLPMYISRQSAKCWKDDRSQPAAKDVRVGVMGLGFLGSDAASKLRIVGFDVAGWSKRRKDLEGIECFAGYDELPDFLGRTDMLLALLPLTNETTGILNRSLFCQMAKGGALGGPVLLNAGRGACQVEADVVSCLVDGTLAGASLDVFESEPLSEKSPLWSHPKVLISPHNAAMSDPNLIAADIADQICRFETGAAFSNTIRREVGY